MPRSTGERIRLALMDPVNFLSIFLAVVNGWRIKAWLRFTMAGRVTIGKGFRAYNRIIIRGPGKICIGANFSCRRTMLKYPVILTHDREATVVVGDGNYFGGTQISCLRRVVIGDEVLLANTFISDSDILPHPDFPIDQGWIAENSLPVRIGDHCWLGMNSMVLKGVEMENECVVSAGSVVIRKAGAFSLLMGNPARKIGRTREKG